MAAAANGVNEANDAVDEEEFQFFSVRIDDEKSGAAAVKNEFSQRKATIKP